MSERREDNHEGGERRRFMLVLNADWMSFDQSNSVRIGDRESEGHISRIRLEPNIL